jgi:hypothetical protein
MAILVNCRKTFFCLLASAMAGLLISGVPSLTHAEDAKPAVDEISQSASIDFVLGNSIFVLLHEFGHVLIRDFDIPLLGLEENSADTIAAVVLIRADRRQAERQPRLSEYLAMAALGNSLIWQTGMEKSHKEIVYWAQHEISVRRATRVICLLYGSDTEEFGWLANAVEMPEERRDVCEDEFDIAHKAVDWVVATYGQTAADHPDLERPEIEVKYGQPRTEAQTRLLASIREAGMLEIVTAFIRSQFILPDSMTLRLRSCGGPNAYWDIDYRELIFCLELLEGLEKIGNTPQVQQLQDEFAAARE